LPDQQERTVAVLPFDEPSSGVDSGTRIELLRLIGQADARAAVAMSTTYEPPVAHRSVFIGRRAGADRGPLAPVLQIP
jgi:ABC-type sugar transport system ATPase subunit